MIRKKGKELFELLKDKERVQTESQRPDIGLISESRPNNDTAESKPVLSLRQEACIFGGIILILLLIVTFILGYYKGRNDAMSFDYGVPNGVKGRVVRSSSSPSVSNRSVHPSSQAVVPPMRDSIPTVTSTTPHRSSTASSSGKYTLRVWTGTRSAVGKAREVVDFFNDKGFNARSHKDHEGIKVFIDRFKSKSAPDAVRIRNQVRELIYKGSRSFQDCYFVISEG
jgi:hypothetical protein